MPDYKFKNGVTFKGTVEQIADYAKTIGEELDVEKLPNAPRGYYFSKTRGVLKISEMETTHIVNALTKHTVDYYEELGKRNRYDATAFVKGFTSLTANPIVEDLFTELTRRK
jgi:hypothetical protein